MNGQTRFVQNHEDAYQPLTRHWYDFRGGFEKGEWIFIGVIFALPTLTPIWTFNHPWIYAISLAIPFQVVWGLRLIHKDGRTLNTWARQTSGFFFHRKRPLQREIYINGKPTFLEPEVRSEAIVALPNPERSGTWRARLQPHR